MIYFLNVLSRMSCYCWCNSNLASNYLFHMMEKIRFINNSVDHVNYLLGWWTVSCPSFIKDRVCCLDWLLPIWILITMKKKNCFLMDALCLSQHDNKKLSLQLKFSHIIYLFPHSVFLKLTKMKNQILQFLI